MAEFTVVVLEATGLKETELVGKQDPYVEIRTNQERKCTSVRQNAGKNAGKGSQLVLNIVWNEEKKLSAKAPIGYMQFNMYL